MEEARNSNDRRQVRDVDVFTEWPVRDMPGQTKRSIGG